MNWRGVVMWGSGDIGGVDSGGGGEEEEAKFGVRRLES